MEKIEALAKFLGIEDLEEITETKWDTFEVNPHTKKIGSSPITMQRNIDLVKEALYLAKVNRVFNLESKDFTPDLYNALSKVFYKYCEHLTKIGIHDLINTSYFLCGGSKDTSLDSKQLEYTSQYKDLFDGNEITDNREEIEVSDGEYMVLDDDEADQKAREYNESLLDDTVLSQIPSNLHQYFDTDAYIDDCMVDGRGSCLASYDSEENQEGEYFIYRVG